MEKPEDINDEPDKVVEEEELDEAALFKRVSRNDSRGEIDNKEERIFRSSVILEWIYIFIEIFVYLGSWELARRLLI